MRVLVVEDEKPAARRLQQLLSEQDKNIAVLAVIDSVGGAVEWLKTHPAPDLIFLDIQLADGYSFEIFKQINLDIPVIFTTAYDEYALQAFEHNSIDYLLKPIDHEKLERSLRKYNNMARTNDKAIQEVHQMIQNLKLGKSYKSRLLIWQRDHLVSVEDHQIAYLRAENKMVVMVTFENRFFTMDYTMETYEEQLNPEVFFRLNRSILANGKAIASIARHFYGKLKIELNPPLKEEVFVSREKADSFKQWLEHH